MTQTAPGWAPFIPPHPPPWPAVPSLLRALPRGDGELLALLPSEAYRMTTEPRRMARPSRSTSR